MTRHLAELRLPQIDSIAPEAIVIQPIGAIEQHGPHLPFNTDLVIAQRTASELVDRHGDDLDLWLLPPIAYSKSNEHSWAGGTVWLSASTMLSLLDDLGRSVSRLPASRLVFLNGHGGNSSLLNVACRELRIDHGLATFLMHPMVPPDQGGPSSGSEQGMGVHGGFIETSLMLHLEPESVDTTALWRNMPEALAGNRHVGFGGPVTFGWTSDDFGHDGHIGDPTGASAGVGAEAFEAAVESLAEALAEVADFPV